MTVIAEGVEDTPQRDRLNEIGCELAQGFLFAAPMTNTAFTLLLKQAGNEPLCLPATAR